jgi:transposase-like protein
MGQSVDLAKKQTIITKIRDEGRRVSEVATEYDVSTKTIYGWLKQGVGGGDSSALEVARLKRELEAVYGVLGKVTAELKRPKK